MAETAVVSQEKEVISLEASVTAGRTTLYLTGGSIVRLTKAQFHKGGIDRYDGQ